MANPVSGHPGADQSAPVTIDSTSDHKGLRFPEMDYYMDESRSDVIFLIDGHRIPALKQYLSIKSEVFRGMFTNGFKETADREVVVEDTSAEAFKVMLRYMYCERLVLPEGQDFQLIHHVLKLADYYQLFRLIDSCERHLIATIGLENVEIIARLANDYRMSDLISVVKAFLDTNFNHFLSSRDQSSLNSLNTSTDNLFFEIMTKNFRKTKLFFEPMTKTRTYCAGAKNSYGYQESSHYYYTPDAGQYSTFSFDKLHES